MGHGGNTERERDMYRDRSRDKSQDAARDFPSTCGGNGKTEVSMSGSYAGNRAQDAVSGALKICYTSLNNVPANLGIPT